jgi:hypothetical protein
MVTKGHAAINMTATTTILSARRASALPVEAQAFLASISEGDGISEVRG